MKLPDLEDESIYLLTVRDDNICYYALASREGEVLTWKKKEDALAYVNSKLTTETGGVRGLMVKINKTTKDILAGYIDCKKFYNIIKGTYSFYGLALTGAGYIVCRTQQGDHVVFNDYDAAVEWECM